MHFLRVTRKVLLFLCFLYAGCSSTHGKEIDLNRTPSPEPEELVEPNFPAPVHEAREKGTVSTNVKEVRSTVGKQAIAIALASGFKKGSREYERLYKQQYYQIRKNLGSKFYDPKKGDPETQLKEYRKKMVEKSRIYRKQIHDRKEAGQMTKADIRYFEKGREGNLRRYWRAPELSREKANKRHRKAYQKDPQRAREMAKKRRKISKQDENPLDSHAKSPSA